MTYRPPKPRALVFSLRSRIIRGTETTVCLISKNVIDHLLMGASVSHPLIEHIVEPYRRIPNGLMYSGAPLLRLLADISELVCLIQ